MDFVFSYPHCTHSCFVLLFLLSISHHYPFSGKGLCRKILGAAVSHGKASVMCMILVLSPLPYYDTAMTRERYAVTGEVTGSSRSALSSRSPNSIRSPDLPPTLLHHTFRPLTLPVDCSTTRLAQAPHQRPHISPRPLEMTTWRCSQPWCTSALRVQHHHQTA